MIDVSNQKHIPVLVLTANGSAAHAFTPHLLSAGLIPDMTSVDTTAAFQSALVLHPALILAEYPLQQLNVLDAVSLVRKQGLDTPIILITDAPAPDSVRDWIHLGIDDIVLKQHLPQLGIAVLSVLVRKSINAQSPNSTSIPHPCKHTSPADVPWSVLFDTFPAQIALLDDQGTITEVNEAWRRFGQDNNLQSPNHGIGLNYIDLCENAAGQWSEGAATIGENIRSLLQGTIHNFALEYTSHTATGKRWFLIMSAPLCTSPVYRAVVMHINMTGHYLAREALTLETKRLQESQRVAKVGCWDMDHTINLNTWTEETYRIFDRNPETFTPSFEAFLELVHPEDREKVEIAYYKSLGQTGTCTLEHRILLPSGVMKYIEERWHTQYASDGTPLRSFGTCQDITERKQAEQLQMQSQRLSLANLELEHTNRLKSEFLAIMSHELRTPLNAILGLSEVLLEQIVGPLTPRQVKAIDTIATSGKHLLELINDILDLSKIEAGKIELIKENIPVEEFCQSCLLFVRTQAIQKRITVSCEIHDQITSIFADPTRLKQILVNLLINAVNFTPDGGKIGLSVKQVPGQNAIEFSIWDTGIGIAPEDLPKLFQAFSQLDSGLTRTHQGTGLGLALVDKLVRMHGGTVAVDSSPGTGSRFSAIIPVEKPTVQYAATTPPLESGSIESSTNVQECKTTRNQRILLAEDNAANSETIGEYLTDKGFCIDYANNGAVAVELARTSQPDLIIMDIQMPVMDGLLAIQKIRTIDSLINVPIIALTAHAMLGDRERCLSSGATAYLSKPVSMEALVTLINKLIQSAS